jgi:hypothetical protein
MTAHAKDRSAGGTEKTKENRSIGATLQAACKSASEKVEKSPTWLKNIYERNRRAEEQLRQRAIDGCGPWP